jgi:hypothetical protein
VKSQGKSSPGSSRSKRVDNIKMDLEAKRWKGLYCIAMDQEEEAGFCGFDNEPSGFHKMQEFIDKLRNR